MLLKTACRMLPNSKPGRSFTSRVTIVLLTASITINAYLLLFTHNKKLQTKNIVSLNEKNLAFLGERKEANIAVKRDLLQEAKPGNIGEPKVNFEIKQDIKVEQPIKPEPAKDNTDEEPKKINNAKVKNSDDIKKLEQNPPPPQQSFCEDKSIWLNHLVVPDRPTDLRDWTFRRQRKCPNFSVDKYPVIRPKISLYCNGKSSMMVLSNTTSTRDVTSVEFGNKCLADVIDNCCVGKQSVPNVVHYIWYAEKDLGYFQFISFMSALRFIKPCLILIHGMHLPKGKHWDYFVSISPNIIHVVREKPNEIFGHKLAFAEHASDVMRIEALKLYGGIYLDFDEIVLRPLEPLRKYEYTQGHERDVTMGSQLVMAKKNATFLNYWYNSYRDDYRKEWAWNALWVPEKLSKKYPKLIHVEGYNFTRPNWQHVDQIFNKNYDWSTNYGMHLYIRWYKNETNNVVIRTLNTTIGSVCRHVVFGNKELCVN